MLNYLPPTKKTKKSIHVLFGRPGKSEKEDERASERGVKNPLCAVFKLSRRRSEKHLPNLCALALQGGK